MTKGQLRGIRMVRAGMVCAILCTGWGCSLVGNRETTGAAPSSAKGSEEKPAAGEVAPEAPRKKVAEIVGTVRLCQDGFVLIEVERMGKPAPAAGTELIVVGTDGTPKEVELKLSDARKGSFFVADVLQGVPAIGDRVGTVSGPPVKKPELASPPGN